MALSYLPANIRAKQSAPEKDNAAPPAPPPKPALTETQKPEAAKRDAELTLTAVVVKRLREAMKDPSSFDLVKASVIEKTGAICIIYRARNSFNAKVTEEIALTKNLKKGAWNSLCANQMNHDYTSAVRLIIE